jgi:F0F1-type ATP synthase assembly protein I
MAWLAVAVFAVVVGLAAGWLLDRHADRRRGARR